MEKNQNENQQVKKKNYFKYAVAGFFIGLVLGGIPLVIYTKDPGDITLPGYLGLAIGVAIGQRKSK